MRALAAARRRLDAVRANDDDGFTMIEITVVMVIMSIVLIIFTSGITQAFSAANRVDTASNTEMQLNTAFERLDKEIRYASAVSTQGTASGMPYIEFLTSNSGTNVCTELRLQTSSGQLQQRTWTQGMTPLSPNAWVPIASQITSATFTFLAANTTFNFQRLQIALTAVAGSNAQATTKSSSITFTALNTSLTTTSATTCTEGRAVP